MKAFFAKHRSPILLLAGLVLFAGAFQLAELLVGPDERPAAADSPEPPGEPIEIEVLRPDDSTVVIEIGGIRHSTVRIETEREGRVDELVACIEEGIAQARREGLLDQADAGMFARQVERHRVGEQLSRIQSDCLQLNIGRHRRDD